MTRLRLPSEYYLRRAVENYERAGNLLAAATLLAGHNQPAEAARRFEALGNWPAAGEAYLAAGQVDRALSCFRRAQLREEELKCLLILGDNIAAALLLLDLGRPDQVSSHLERAVTAATDLTSQATLRLHLARALTLSGQAEAGEQQYRTVLTLLPHLPATPASVEVWIALGTWGQATGRQDLIQEGYAHALRLLKNLGDQNRWRVVAECYQAIAGAYGNRQLVRLLAEQLKTPT